MINESEYYHERHFLSNEYNVIKITTHNNKKE